MIEDLLQSYKTQWDDLTSTEKIARAKLEEIQEFLEQLSYRQVYLKGAIDALSQIGVNTNGST